MSVTLDTNKNSEPLDVAARVVWCTGIGDEFQLGLQFLDLDKKQAEYLDVLLRLLAAGQAKLAAKRPPPYPSDPFES